MRIFKQSLHEMLLLVHPVYRTEKKMDMDKERDAKRDCPSTLKREKEDSRRLNESPKLGRNLDEFC